MVNAEPTSVSIKPTNNVIRAQQLELSPLEHMLNQTVSSPHQWMLGLWQLLILTLWQLMFDTRHREKPRQLQCKERRHFHFVKYPAITLLFWFRLVSNPPLSGFIQFFIWVPKQPFSKKKLKPWSRYPIGVKDTKLSQHWTIRGNKI